MAHRLLTEAEVRERTGLSHSTIWRRVREGTFPAPFKYGGERTNRWIEAEIDEHLARVIAAAQRVPYAGAGPTKKAAAAGAR
jgi:predicted DNA-binding transcriptional regulator AlpA